VYESDLGDLKRMGESETNMPQPKVYEGSVGGIHPDITPEQWEELREMLKEEREGRRPRPS